MSVSQSLIMRDDTFLGVCEALGQDFGVHSNWFRAAFGMSLLWNPVVSISAYFGVGLIVLASRLLFPHRRLPGAGETAGEQAALAEQVETGGPEVEALSIAA